MLYLVERGCTNFTQKTPYKCYLCSLYSTQDTPCCSWYVQTCEGTNTLIIIYNLYILLIKVIFDITIIILTYYDSRVIKYTELLHTEI